MAIERFNTERLRREYNRRVRPECRFPLRQSAEFKVWVIELAGAGVMHIPVAAGVSLTRRPCEIAIYGQVERA